MNKDKVYVDTSEYLNHLLNNRDFQLQLLVDVFLQMYPDARFGHGHVVLDDGNWNSINFCLNKIGEEYNEKKIYEKLQYDLTDDEKELIDTRNFLIVLRSVAHSFGIVQTSTFC